MTVTKATALRLTCDLPACGDTELFERSDLSASLPTGWFELEVPTADRLTFNSEQCLLRFVRSLGMTEYDGTAQIVGSVNAALDRQAVSDVR